MEKEEIKNKEQNNTEEVIKDKSEIKKMIKDELEKEMKARLGKAVKEEVEKALKGKASKEQIGDIFTKGSFTALQWEVLLKLARIGLSFGRLTVTN